MDNKVLLAVYGITVTSNSDIQIPSAFGGNVDLLKLFHDFADFILKNVQKWERKTSSTLALTCSTLPKIEEEAREAYGFFKAGRDGASFTVANFNTENATTIDVTRDLHTIRDAFFYLYVPKGQKKAYLVLQRSYSQGIKDLVRHFFQDFINTKGLQKYRINFTNLLNDRLFEQMLNNGKFKEVTVVKNSIPLNVDEVRYTDDQVVKGEGSIKTVYQAPDLAPSWKEWALRTMRDKKLNMVDGDTRAKIALGGELDHVNEVSFRVELNQKQKTFHLVNEGRTQPDMDVTENMQPGTDGKYTVEDLLTQARELVNDVSPKIDGNGAMEDTI